MLSTAVATLALNLLLSVDPVQPWKAGVARADITPTTPMWMAGYAARTKPAKGMVHSLWVKALALEDAAGARAVIVTSDLLGFPKDLAHGVLGRLKVRLGLEPRQVMLTASHTHCGPVLGKAVSPALGDIYPMDDHHRKLVVAYTAELETKVVDTVITAFARLEPATVAIGVGQCDFAVNRRENPEKDVAALKRENRLKGPVDHSVPVLLVSNLSGKLRVVLFGYACHNTTLSDYQWCGDYAGFAQLALEAKHSNTTAMFMMGCGGDQNPLPRRTVSLAKQYGEQLAAAVDVVVSRPATTLSSQLRTAQVSIDLTMSAPPSRADLEARAKAGVEYQRRWASRMLQELNAGKSLGGTYPYPIQAWRLGDHLLWVSLGGEVVVDFAHRLRRDIDAHLWVTAYANDVMAYIPSLRVLKEGGYEGQSSMQVYGLPALRWADDVEERIIRAATNLTRTVTSP